MSEHGFYHPSIGYWQTNGDVPHATLASYPEGTIETDLRPIEGYHELVGTHWLPREPPLADRRAAAKARVDSTAEAYRLTYIAAGSGQAMAYTQKLDEARAYLADPSLTAVECPHIFAEVGITGETAEAVALVVVGMHAAWQTKSADIEHKRLAAKATIDAAETAEAIIAAADVDWSA